MRSDLPAGTVTLLFTDVEGSTRLLHGLGADRYADALQQHRELLREAFAASGGAEVDTQGDAFFVAFRTAADAATAALAGREALRNTSVRVRMGLHTGTPAVTAEGYVGPDVHLGARIAALAHGGQILLTDPTRALLDTDVEVIDLGRHRVKDFDHTIRVFQLGDDAFPPLRTPGSVDLPTPATPFVGRQVELYDAAATWLEREPRVVTIVGPGGIGKTRFAIELARLLAEEADGGTAFVPLASLRDHALLLPTVGERLGAPAVDAAGIAARLGDRRTHLVLDNLEQLLPQAAAPIAELVAAAPQLRLLVTSREPLRIRGETEVDLDSLAAEDALLLFLDRARAVGVDLSPSPAASELCARLDRLPLAIELAAARMKLLTPEQALERLGDALDLLKGSRDAERRHATLRATIDWSYELLDDADRLAFAALAVFRGGWTIEAAEAVCSVDLDTLASLLDKSLVRRRRETEDGERFWMLETIRSFARERLSEWPERDAEVRRRHAEHVLEIARAAHLSSEEQGRARPDFQLAFSEREEIRAALDWGCEHDVLLAAEILTTLEQMWVTSAMWEGRRVVELLLESASELPPLLRARLLRLHGGIVILVGERDLGERRYREAIDLFESVGDSESVRALLARFAVHAGYHAEPAEARRQIADVRRLNETDHSPMIEAQLLSASGDLAWREGDRERALDLSRASVEAAAGCGFRFWELWQLLTLASYQLELGRTDDVVSTVGRALDLASALQDERIRRWTSVVLARALLEHDPDRAGLVWGAILVEETERSWISQAPDFQVESAPLATCVEPRFVDAVKAGRTMPLGEAIAAALDSDQTVP